MIGQVKSLGHFDAVQSSQFRVIRDFFWKGNKENGVIILVNWETTFLHLVVGGLGIGNLATKNKALLAKWSWKFLMEMKFCGDR